MKCHSSETFNSRDFTVKPSAHVAKVYSYKIFDNLGIRKTFFPLSICNLSHCDGKDSFKNERPQPDIYAVQLYIVRHTWNTLHDKHHTIDIHYKH